MDANIVSYSKIFNSNNNYNGELVKNYIDRLKELDYHTPSLESFILVTNTSTQSYEYVGKDFELTLGLQRNSMISNGLNYYISHYHPDDLPILLKAFEDLMAFTMTKLKLEQRRRVVYSWNYRIRNSNGAYKNMQVQQTPIFFDADGKPIIGYSQNTVTGNGKCRPIIATCKFLNEDNIFETLYVKNYYYDSLVALLSKRELEIISLIAKGNTTKTIAGYLNISHQTVSSHRKNILSKIELNSTAEIIAYCNKYDIF
ncbi:LuxR C-terminal-related transcriptional regulator [Tamlana sp. 62-3]|uniref:LuxR C-terminal-related transcriptional regulator n=1 Tax=Neotamlana sargassicola TaxID=2883125 RepID=A0A9X1I7Y7_9FLAO|nr:LuxR C-terminal-related transcriptional regulator [Tamlana sargassicola]MCB4808454.1 LuxR C-terminal-related transcriptional regulator [Tamlana sargassicola]